MDWGVLENCVAMVAITCVAVFASKFNLDQALSSAAIAAIAGLAGHGVSSIFTKKTKLGE